VTPPKAKLGWGVIGIGSIVNGTIAPAMVAEDDCDLVAGVSRDMGRAEAFRDRFGARRAYTDYAEMLADPEVEAVFIATPNAQHADQVVAAAEAGKHVLCDKPMATSVADAARSVQACAEAGVRFGINFHNRHLPWVRDTAALLASGAVGRVSTVQVEAGSGTRVYRNWRADPAMAGLGTLYNVGVHVLDFLGVLLDSVAVEVVAMFDHDPDGRQVDMTDLVLLRFANDTRAYVHFSETNPYPQNHIALYGSSGRITGVNLTRSRSDGVLTVRTADGERVKDYPSPGAHRLSVAAFTRAVLDGREPNASGLDGLRSMVLCDAIARSVRERRVVEVDYAGESGGLLDGV
jgi:1,5-anhydro-D-fructose reductase (1,5-anhydro-D-mannitol-forming)